MAAPMLLTNCQIVKMSKYLIVRRFHTNLALRNVAQKSKYMQKLLTKGNRKKDRWFMPTNVQIELPTASDASTAKMQRKYSDRMMRRTKWISTTLFEEISQIFDSGILEMHVTVLKVDILPDMSAIKVFWEATGNHEQDDSIQERLNNLTGRLRHELIQSQVIGQVPAIIFMKDLTTYRQRHIEEILANLDTGPPTDIEDNDDGDSSDLDTDTEDNDLSTLDDRVIRHSIDRLKEISISDDLDSRNGTPDSGTKLTNSFTTQAIDVGKPVASQAKKPLDKTITNENLGELSDGGKKEFHELDNTLNDDDSDKKVFRQDLYGLQHDLLMHKVVNAKISSGFRPMVESGNSTTSWDDSKWRQDGKRALKTEGKKEKRESIRKQRAQRLRQYEDEFEDSR